MNQEKAPIIFVCEGNPTTGTLQSLKKGSLVKISPNVPDQIAGKVLQIQKKTAVLCPFCRNRESPRENLVDSYELHGTDWAFCACQYHGWVWFKNSPSTKKEEK